MRMEVTCAILIKDGKVLACQRKGTSDHPYKWEFPGGKIERDETAEECIVREMKEELGVDVIVQKKLTPVNFDYHFKKIMLIPFLCILENGILMAVEHQAIKWVSRRDFLDVDWLEADRILIAKNDIFNFID